MRPAPLPAYLLLVWPFLVPSAARPAPPASDAGDCFLAGALGVMPFASGFYVTRSPMNGAFFTLMDILLAAGIYNASRGYNQSRDNIPVYFALMGANNAADATLAVLKVRADGGPRLLGWARPRGGAELRLAWPL